MTPDEMKKALEHDAAIKAAKATEAKAPAAPAETQQHVPIKLVIQEMEDKQVLLAKSTAMGLVEIARRFTDLALSTGKQRIIVDKKTGKQEIEQDPPRAGVAESCLKVVGLALDLARTADALGDRPLARKDDGKKAI
jgi:hypothetical protein